MRRITKHTSLALGPLGALLGLALASAPAHAGPPEGPALAPDTSEAMKRPVDARALETYDDPVARVLTPTPGGLTAADAGRRASQTDPTLELRRAELRRAAATMDRAMWSFIPRVGVEASYARLNPITIDFADGSSLVGATNEGPLAVGQCPPPAPVGAQCVLDGGGAPVGAQRAVAEVPVDSISLTARLGVPISDYVLRLIPTRDAVAGRTRAAELRAEAEKRTIVADTQIAYYDWLRTEAALAVAEQSLERSLARLADAEAALLEGDAAVADVKRLDAQVAQVEGSIVAARSTRDLAAIALAVAMGEYDESGDTTTYTIGEDVLSVEPASPSEPTQAEELVREAYQHRPELAMLDASVRATQRATRATRTGYFPRLDGFAEATYARPNARYFPPPDEFRGNWMVGVSLTWSLDQAIVTRAEVREQKADTSALLAQEAAVKRGITLEVHSAHQARIQAQESIPLNARAVEAAEVAYQATAAAFREGAATATDVIEAEEQRARASLLDANARIDLRVADVRLRHATGREL